MIYPRCVYCRRYADDTVKCYFCKPMTVGQVAGKWWADKLRVPNAVQDNGGRDELNNRFRPMLSSLTHMLCAKLDPAIIQKFEDEIAKIVDERLAFVAIAAVRDPVSYHAELGLVVDYEPQWLLREAYVAAGLGTRQHLLPYKTDMTVTPDRIEVREGYDAARVEIWRR